MFFDDVMLWYKAHILHIFVLSLLNNALAIILQREEHVFVTSG